MRGCPRERGHTVVRDNAVSIRQKVSRRGINCSTRRWKEYMQFHSYNYSNCPVNRRVSVMKMSPLVFKPPISNQNILCFSFMQVKSCLSHLLRVGVIGNI